MNQNKFNGEGSNYANFAKKATLATITAMAALTLAACGNNDAGAKPAGSSEPKTEQSATNNNNTSSSDNSANNNSIVGNVTNTPESFSDFKATVTAGGYTITSTTQNEDGYTANVTVDGHKGTIGNGKGTDDWVVSFPDLNINDQISKLYNGMNATYICSKE
ncbi:hypothetical protein [Lactococcus hircilactis]|uniref:hypothetical protein n=1 Tax=Lactococcus hircilactis TaxID=1494462 RepID=UPI003FA31E46